MKKIGALVLSLVLVAAAVSAQVAPGKRPEATTISGAVKVQAVDAAHSGAVLTTGEGKEYLLVGIGDIPRGNPPSGAPADKRPDDGNGPAPVKNEELLALDGQSVSVTGFVPPVPTEAERAKLPNGGKLPEGVTLPKDGVFIVVSCKAQ